MTVLRWILFLPGAVLAAWLAWFLSGSLVSLSMSYGFSTDSFLGKLYVNSTSYASMGAAFVYSGAKIAPGSQVLIAYVMSGIGLVLGGFMLFPSFMIGDGWDIWGGICFLVGIGIIISNIKNGETDIVS